MDAVEGGGVRHQNSGVGELYYSQQTYSSGFCEEVLDNLSDVFLQTTANRRCKEFFIVALPDEGVCSRVLNGWVEALEHS